MINPTAMILSAALMLRHINEMSAAVAVEQGVLAALEDGVLTRDVVGDTGAASTTAFTDAGSALPPVCFIICPTKKPRSAVLPAR